MQVVNIVQSLQCNKSTNMSTPIRIHNTVALLAAIVVGAFALGRSVSADLHVPAARMLAAECQGFEALASAGHPTLTCNADVALAAPHDARAKG